MANELTSEKARTMEAARKVRRGGRPKVLHVCPKCDGEMGRREYDAHVWTCKGKPAGQEAPHGGE